jgi:penicillin-binding protein 2
MHDDFMDNGIRERRSRWLFAAVVVLFGTLSVRLYLLQIADWELYRIQSENNTMQPVPIEASRGLIRDRNDRILVDNRPSYTISAVPNRLLRNTDAALRERVMVRLGQTIGMPGKAIEKRLRSSRRHDYKPVKLRRDVSFEAVSVIEEDRYDLPGVEIQIEARRGYPSISGTFPLAPHVLGYVGLIDADQYPQMRSLGYSFGDQVGKRGVERLCEPMLRGRDGIRYIEVNARGREVGSFPEKTAAPESGHDIVLTLDWRLQLVAERAFADTMTGSLIAMDPRTGEILCMVSKPGFHPQSIRNVREWQALQSDPAKPLLNRSIQGEYPPGSVLKMVTACAALDMGLITTDEVRYGPCVGELAVGDRVFRCHGVHGDMNLRQALVHSCDVFFYHLGREVGITNWNRYAKMFGLGRATGIDVAAGGDGEARGLITDRAYYEKTYGRWVEGFMLNLAIGQGETSTTPIQVARYFCGIAVGALPQPYVLARNAGRSRPEPVALSENCLERIRSMLVDVVSSPYGTGRRARIDGVHVGGKTGTAQNSGRDHAWFTAFAPAEDPELVVVVLAENAGNGSEVAAPMARKVLSAYFEMVAPGRAQPAALAAGLLPGENREQRGAPTPRVGERSVAVSDAEATQ